MSTAQILISTRLVLGGTSTWNPADKDADITLSNGNLTASISANHGSVRGTLGRASGSGVYQFECTITDDTVHLVGIGNSSATLSFFPGQDANGWAYFLQNGNKYTNGSGVGFGAGFNQSETIGIVWDAAAGTVSAYKDGALQGGGTMFTGLSGTMYPMWGPGSGSGTRTCTINCGQTAFTFPIIGATAWG